MENSSLYRLALPLCPASFRYNIYFLSHELLVAGESSSAAQLWSQSLDFNVWSSVEVRRYRVVTLITAVSTCCSRVGTCFFFWGMFEECVVSEFTGKWKKKVWSHHHLSLNREGRWGTTDDFIISFLLFILFSTAPLGLAELQASPFPDNVFPPLLLWENKKQNKKTLLQRIMEAQCCVERLEWHVMFWSVTYFSAVRLLVSFARWSKLGTFLNERRWCSTVEAGQLYFQRCHCSLQLHSFGVSDNWLSHRHSWTDFFLLLFFLLHFPPSMPSPTHDFTNSSVVFDTRIMCLQCWLAAIMRESRWRFQDLPVWN